MNELDKLKIKAYDLGVQYNLYLQKLQDLEKQIIALNGKIKELEDN